MTELWPGLSDKSGSSDQQSFPSIRIGKDKNADGENEVTITILRGAPPKLTSTAHIARLKRSDKQSHKARLPKPIVKTTLNAEGTGYDVYVALINSDDTVVVGRPQSESRGRGS